MLCLQDFDESVADFYRLKSPKAPWGQIFIRVDSWQGADFFRADTTLHNYFLARARRWLLDRYPGCLAFHPVETK
jgi:hypothetical protein